MELTEILPQLTDWFPVEDHKKRPVKGGSRWYYLSHQAIRDRLNEICPGHWSTEYEGPTLIEGEPVYLCRLTICGVTRTGIGDKSNEPSVYGTAAQRAFRKAFVDSAEMFGIGAYLDEQTSEKTKRNFIRYMQQNGNGKAAVLEQQQRTGSTEQASDRPRKVEKGQPFGQRTEQRKSGKDDNSHKPTTTDNAAKFSAIAQYTGYSFDAIRAIATRLNLPNNSALLDQAQALQLRNEIYADWGVQQRKFNGLVHARNSLQKVLADFEYPDANDLLVWEKWRLKVQEKAAEVVRITG
jgi:hypothetical protein